jgi:lipoate-protein ligase A
MLDEAHRYVLGTVLDALRPLVAKADRQGTSDLTLDNAKISGNSMRCRRRTFLYHGTLLYDFSLSLVDECLRIPPRQPDYRRSRTNRSFLANLPISVHDLRRALIDAWGATPTDRDWPRHRVQELVATRYSQPDWNCKR